MIKRTPVDLYDTPQLQPGERIRYEKDGSTSCTRRERVRWDLWQRYVPRRNVTRHPELRHLIADSVEVQRLAADIAEITTTYFGPGPQTLTGTTQPNADGRYAPSDDYGPEKNIEQSQLDIDIQLHPEFWSIVEDAGYANCFDPNGQFKGIPPGYKLSGLTAYPSWQITERYAWTTLRQVTGVPVPAQIGSRGRRVGFTSNLRGGVWRNEETIVYGDHMAAGLV